MIIRELKNNVFNWKFFLGILLSMYLVWFLSKEFDYQNFKRILMSINLIYIFFAVLILLLSVYFRSIRWKLLFNPADNVDTRILFDMQLIGYFGNNILPLRLGEIIKAYLLGNKLNISKSRVFGTIVLERFLDIAGVLFLLFYSLFFSSNQFQSFFISYSKIDLIIALSLFIIIIVSLSYLIKNFKIRNLNDNFILNSINDLILGFSSLNRKNSIFISIYTILIWSCYVLIVYLTQLSINFNLSILDSIFILLISTIWLAIPSAPASIGTFEMGVAIALGILNISANVVEFSIILHSVTFFPYTLIGGYFFFKFYFNENKKI